MQVVLFEQDGQGIWAVTQKLTPEPAQAALSNGNHKGRSADFSAKLAKFKAPAQVRAGDCTRQQSPVCPRPSSQDFCLVGYCFAVSAAPSSSCAEGTARECVAVARVKYAGALSNTSCVAR